jgi:hypothetical protein
MSEDDTYQSGLLISPPEEPKSDTVYVVAANYDGDPHPHIEGVWTDKEQAKGMVAQCRQTTIPPHPVAWQMFEVEVNGEVDVYERY